MVESFLKKEKATNSFKNKNKKDLKTRKLCTKTPLNLTS